jgi:hypothetical protein
MLTCIMLDPRRSRILLPIAWYLRSSDLHQNLIFIETPNYLTECINKKKSSKISALMLFFGGALLTSLQVMPNLISDLLAVHGHEVVNLGREHIIYLGYESRYLARCSWLPASLSGGGLLSPLVLPFYYYISQSRLATSNGFFSWRSLLPSHNGSYPCSSPYRLQGRYESP